MSRRHFSMTKLVASHVGRMFAVGCLFGLCAALFGVISPASSFAGDVSPMSPNWCGAFGASFVGWSKTTPNIPICGPGPDYGGTWQIVDLPDPGGSLAGYLNGTPGFQCVEFAERYLDVAYGFAPINAEGSTVALNYHEAYPRTTLIVNGSPGAVGHAPSPGDVVSFALSPGFDDYSDGHVAIVVRSNVDPATGNGTIVVAQENVSSSDYLYTLNVVSWRLHDPTEPNNAEFQFPYAEWLHVQALTQQGSQSTLVRPPKVPKPTNLAVLST